ncbi:ABC transporter permease [Amycolatopsis sp. NPDC059657]|uniref:ABC transporter permease n=1 Tax=Amycolatopsis sp. NPDC059657 TaxID=3346899 RepID=UPI0036723763
MNALTIAGASLRRLLRDRLSLFFVVLLPVVVILVIGMTVGGRPAFRVGLVTAPGPLAAELADDLKSLGPKTFEDDQAALDALRRNELDAVVRIPPDVDATLAAGGTVEIPLLLTASTGGGQGAWTAVSSVVARHASVVQAAAFAAANAGGTLGSRLALARSLEAATPRVSVRTEVVDSAGDTLPPGFGYSAPTMLVLFVFINTLAAGAAMVETRRLGIYSRALAAPVRARDIVLGEGLCYFGLALLQSALIVTCGALLFGVSWGDPLAAIALTATWALVGTGAGMLSGTLFRTPEQVSAIGPAIGIAFGMLGGCMWPLEIVTGVVRSLGHFTPHAWAVDAWTTLLSRGGTLVSILVPLGVLGGFALVLLGFASWRLRRSLLT